MQTTVTDHQNRELTLTSTEVIDQFIDHVTQSGTRKIWTLPIRTQPSDARHLVSPLGWFTHEGVHLNPEDTNGPDASYRARRGIPAGDRGQDLVYIHDLDLVKMGYLDTTWEQVRDQYPWGTITAIVPTTTVGNWQVIFCHDLAERGSWYTDNNFLVSHRADPKFSNAVSWNPVMRDITPRPDDEQGTVWFTDLYPGMKTLPVLHSITDLYPEGWETARPAVRVHKATLDPEGVAARLYSAEGPAQIILMSEGLCDGQHRAQHLRGYLTKILMKIGSFDSDVLHHHALDFNTVLGEPLTDERLAEVVAKVDEVHQRWLSRQRHVGSLAGMNRPTFDKHFDSMSTWGIVVRAQQDLEAIRRGETPQYLTPDQQGRVTTFSGPRRWGTKHLAHVLGRGWTPERIETVKREGNRVKYSLEVLDQMRADIDSYFHTKYTQGPDFGSFDPEKI